MGALTKLCEFSVILIQVEGDIAQTDNSQLVSDKAQNSIKWKYYYLTYVPPKDSVQRYKVAKELASQCGIRLHSSLWKIPSQNIKKALNTVLKYEPTVFKRSREIFPPKISFEKQIFDLGSVAIIAYKLPKKSSRKRMAVLRMLRRAPKIKIVSTLLIVPYLKSSRLNAYKGRAVLQDELFNFLDKECVEAHRLGHLKIVYPHSHEGLLRTMIDYEVLICEKVTVSLKGLIYTAKHTENLDLSKSQKILSFYRSEYRDIQGIAYFMYKSMNVDLRPNLKKVYNALIRYRQVLEEKLGQLSVAE